MPNSLPALPLPFSAPAAPHAAHHQLIVPYAALLDDSCQHVLSQLALPNLQQLLQRLSPSHTDTAQQEHPVPPHERVCARIVGMNSDAPAWAALQTGMADTPCAWLTPCHWSAGADQVRMDDPTTLQLDMADAQALLAVLAPWFTEDGLQLEVVTPMLWRVSGAALAQLQAASLDRVLLRDVTPWLPSAAHCRTLHRLHSEVQMLLYTHALNTQRAEQGRLPMNAFWLHGAGMLSSHSLQQAQAQSQQHHVVIADGLRQTALRQDWPAWKAAWLAADAGPVAEVLRHVQQGGSASVHLCGEHHARSWHTQPRSWLSRVQQALRPQRFADWHQAL